MSIFRSAFVNLKALVNINRGIDRETFVIVSVVFTLICYGFLYMVGLRNFTFPEISDAFFNGYIDWLILLAMIVWIAWLAGMIVLCCQRSTDILTSAYPGLFFGFIMPLYQYVQAAPVFDTFGFIVCAAFFIYFCFLTVLPSEGEYD